MGKSNCLQEKPKDTKSKTYIWSEIKNNPNLYCWIPISKKDVNTSEINLDTVNIQDIPYPSLTEYDKKLQDISSKLISIANKKYTEYLEKGIDLISADDPKKYSIVRNFIKEKKLKVYGGTAINSYLPKEYKIYDEYETADYDVYSPQPWNDAVELAQLLYDSGYKYVEVKSRFHKGTYSVEANLWQVIDITYMPSSLFNKLKTKSIKGIQIVTPVRLVEQLYKELSIPFFSPQRYEKVSHRLNLLSYFKPVISKKLSCPSDIFSSHPKPLHQPSQTTLSLLERCNKFITRKKLLISGKQAYNLYIQIGGGNKMVYIDKYTVLSEHAHTDIQKLLTKLLPLVDNPKQLQINTSLNLAMQINKTFYTLVLIENNKIIPICTIHQLDNCTVYKNILKRNVVGITYLKYILLLQIVFGDIEEIKIAKCMYGYLSTVQKHYYKSKKVSEFDDTPFQKYVVDCIGPIKNRRKHSVLQQRWKKQESPDCKKDKEHCLFPCTWNKKTDKCIAIPQSYKIK